MKLRYIFQFCVIIMFLLLGNLVSDLISQWLVIPGSIVGMLLLFVALVTNLMPLEYVEETAQFFLNHMGFFFIPLGVSVIESYILIKEVAFQLVLVLILSNMLVMGFTAKATEMMMKRGER